MSGRGRGISNEPAWMSSSRGSDGGGPGGGGGGGARGPAGGGAPPRHDDRRGGGGGGGPPLYPPDYFDPRDKNGPPYPPPPQGGGGGDYRGGPPPPHFNDRRGGGSGPPPPRRYGDRRGGYDDRGRGDGGGGLGRDNHRRPSHPPPPSSSNTNSNSGDHRQPQRPTPNGASGSMITFRSYEEEREWVEERRRKRLARPSKFDIQPNPALAVADAAAASLAAFQNNPMLLSAAAAAQAVAAAQAAAAAAAAAAQQAAGGPQQTRHSRRLYVGNLPLYVTEEQLHQEFKRAIETAHVGPPLSEDPILSVYINHERRFCFLEFKTVEMTSACMALDGMHIAGGVAVKVKRPNDYNELMAPKIHPSALPVLDVSRLGIVSSTVQDGPNKVFLGGLHYHLTDSQVLDLLQAFGKLKAFHLVKGDSHDASMSKGYCFAEYVDPAVTPIAIHGLHGMDIGGGKTLTARLAGGRGMMMDPSSSMGGVAAAAAVIPAAPPGVVLPPDRTIVAGYDIEAMVDAAMGQGTMPSAPVYKDALGLPLTRIVGAFAPPPIVPPPILAALGALPGLTPPPPPPPQLPPFQQQQQQQQVPLYGMNMNVKTRILVLHNMVQAEDLATTQDYQALTDEVREECAKYGNLLAIKIPRAPDDKIEPSAIQKIFLEYATALDAEKAEAELAGRQFGNQVVQVSYFAEEEFKAGRLR